MLHVGCGDMIVVFTAERSSVGDFRRYFDQPNHQNKLALSISIYHRYCMLKLYVRFTQNKHLVRVGIRSCFGLKYLLLVPETQLENVLKNNTQFCQRTRDLEVVSNNSLRFNRHLTHLCVCSAMEGIAAHDDFCSPEQTFLCL